MRLSSCACVVMLVETSRVAMPIENSDLFNIDSSLHVNYADNVNVNTPVQLKLRPATQTVAAETTVFLNEAMTSRFATTNRRKITYYHDPLAESNSNTRRLPQPFI